MITQEMFRYVQDGLANGKTKDQLQKELLLAGGWQVSDIDEVFAAVEGRMVTPKEEKSGFGKFLLFIVLLAIIGFAAWYLYGDQIQQKVLSVIGGNDPTVTDPAPVVPQNTKKNNEADPEFLASLISNGADQIYKYSYENQQYYFVIDQEIIGGDGVPEVFTLNGEKIACNFGSPMVPMDQRPSLNPICKDYENGELVYTRKQ